LQALHRLLQALHRRGVLFAELARERELTGRHGCSSIVSGSTKLLPQFDQLWSQLVRSAAVKEAAMVAT
jgi:hypothetical protein